MTSSIFLSDEAILNIIIIGHSIANVQTNAAMAKVADMVKQHINSIDNKIITNHTNNSLHTLYSMSILSYVMTSSIIIRL